MLAAGLLVVVHDRDTVYAVILPVVMLTAFIAGPLRGLAWAQGGFTMVVATLFAQVTPSTWQLAPVRLMDVLVGSVIGLACGLVAWPRGAGSEVRRSMAALCSAIADAIGQTTAQVVERAGSTDIFALNRALILARESLAQYQCEARENAAGQPDWPTVLVAGADARRGGRLLPGRPGRIAPHEVGAWLRRAADCTRPTTAPSPTASAPTAVCRTNAPNPSTSAPCWPSPRPCRTTARTGSAARSPPPSSSTR